MMLICGISKEIIALSAARIPDMNLRNMKNVVKYRKAQNLRAGHYHRPSLTYEYIAYGHKESLPLLEKGGAKVPGCNLLPELWSTLYATEKDIKKTESLSQDSYCSTGKGVILSLRKPL